MFEILDCLFMFGGGAPRGEGSQVAALAGFRILLARVQTIFATLQFSDQDSSSTVLQLRVRLWLRLRLVRLAFLAALRRDAEPRSRAADCACLDRERCDAALRPCFLRASVVARERRDVGLRRE
jgi:hypothetical protein